MHGTHTSLFVFMRVLMQLNRRHSNAFDDDSNGDGDSSKRGERKKSTAAQVYAVKYVYRDLVLLRFWHPILSNRSFTFALAL